MKRRAALQLGGSMLLATTAGCSFPQLGTSSGIVISTIHLRTRLDRRVEASLLVTDSEEVVLWRTVTLSTGPDRFVTVDELPAEAGEYTLYAHVPDTDADDAVRVDLVEEADDLSCIEVDLKIDSDPQGDPFINYDFVSRCESQN